MKKLFLIFLFISFPVYSDQLVLYPSISANRTGGTATWSSTNNIFVEDGATADVLTGGLDTKYLAGTGMHASLLHGSIIKGIKLGIKRNESGGSLSDESVILYNPDNSPAPQDKFSAAEWDGSLTYAYYGSSTDTWGQSWTAEQINDTNFGAGLIASAISGTPAAHVDDFQITIYFTPPTSIYNGNIYNGNLH